MCSEVGGAADLFHCPIGTQGALFGCWMSMARLTSGTGLESMLNSWAIL